MSTPSEKLALLKKESGFDLFSKEFALYLDKHDELAEYRNEFHIPKNSDLPSGFVDLKLVNGDDTCVYLCGHSLGLQPKSTKNHVEFELEKWAKLAVLGHNHVKETPWLTIDEFVNGLSAEIAGAKESEVVVMNTLTMNLHVLMVPFYCPTQKRHKILIEGKAFPSDHYAVESQIKFHGYDPKKSLIEVFPRENESTLRTEDILKVIEEQGDTIALVMFSGVQYYTGQLFDMKAITEAGHNKVVVDLAHAFGNVELFLHDWDVDFACWCNYKYINAGPGAIAGAFVHERHAENFELPRFAGWWGHDKETRFEMGPEFKPLSGACGFQVSNPPVFQTVALLASLKLHTKATMKKLREKSMLLTSYMEYLITNCQSVKGNKISILTPSNPLERGAQLSLYFPCDVEEIFTSLEKRGVLADIRRPNVIRCAAVPIYNSFLDVFKFYKFVDELYK